LESTTSPTAGGFRQLLALRAFTLVNDHALKWLAIGLGKRLVDRGEVSLVLTIGLVGLSLPYVLFSWLAGSLADRRSKTSVIRWCKAVEVFIAVAATAVVSFGMLDGQEWLGLPTGLWLLLATVIAIGTQAAVMTPSIVGAIPELVPPSRLTAANGLFALVSLVAILAGTAAGNWVADATPLVREASAWARGLPAGMLLCGAAVAGLVAAVFLPRLPVAAPHAPPAWNALARTWTDLGMLVRQPELAAAAAGIVFFWAIGAVAQANVDQFAMEAGAAAQSQVVPLLVALVAGIGLGSVVTGKLASRPAGSDPQVDLGFVPLGGLIMAFAFLMLACTGGRFVEAGGMPAWLPLVWLVMLGFGAGMFDVPLETYMQAKSPADRLGGVLAVTNLLLFSGMFLASLGYGCLRSPLGPGGAPLFSARAIFALFAVLSLGAAAVAVWCAPRASLRIFVSSIVNATHRFRVAHADRLPATGPAVVVANHLSWLDGFIVVLSSLRSIRMVVYGPNIQGKFLRMLSDQWRFILFDPKPKSMGQALKAIQSGLAAGDVVGIFSEGGISRTGQILGFKRGLEWILERVEAPIVPLHIDGMWGSPLSFSEGRYFTKWPRVFRRPVTLTYGTPLPIGTPSHEARLALQELTATSVRNRMRATLSAEVVAAAATAEAFDGCCLVRRGDRLLVSLAAGDPLQDSLGKHGAQLLGIRSTTADPALLPRQLGETILRERITIWLARVEQVLGLANEQATGSGPTLAGLKNTLDVVVMPIDAVAELPRAREASARFREVFGVEPVVAFAPREAGGLVAMNSPPARATADHEVTLKADTVGRVVNGVVVWPEAAIRDRLGLESLVDQGIPAGESRTLVIGATLPPQAGNGQGTTGPDRPTACLLDTAFDVDKEGFLVVKEPA
jgi:acyl-[acyl-carrier-protein]-phospholipid O-acyltransferase/long-chain-fatty-acid--[acyl-carrier-protein] ligase